MRRDSKKDARLILELAEKGMVKKDVLLKLNLNITQFNYSLKSAFDKEKVNDLRWKFKQNEVQKSSTSIKKSVVKPDVKLDDAEVVIEKIVEERTIDEQTTIAVTEEVKNDHQKIGEGLKKGEYVVLDTSIIGIDEVVEILKNKGVICIFTSIVIEELDKQQKNPNSCGYNAKNLLRLALEDESLVIPIPKKTSLAGWREENSDSFIVQTAFDLKEKYNPVVITSDKVLALKAKCQGLRFQYWSFESNSNKSVESKELILGQDIVKVEKVRDSNEKITINFFEMKGAKYFYPKKGLHRYFLFDEKGHLIENDNGLIPYKPGYILFRIYDHCIQKIELKNHNKKYNSHLICEAFFGEVQQDVKKINILSVIKNNGLLKN